MEKILIVSSRFKTIEVVINTRDEYDAHYHNTDIHKKDKEQAINEGYRGVLYMYTGAEMDRQKSAIFEADRKRLEEKKIRQSSHKTDDKVLTYSRNGFTLEYAL